MCEIEQRSRETRKFALLFAAHVRNLGVSLLADNTGWRCNLLAPYNTKRMCGRECLHSKRKVLSSDFKESEDAESFEINFQVCLRAISLLWE